MVSLMPPDEEARAVAYAEAEALRTRDPEAAAELLARLAATERDAGGDGQAPLAGEPYDPYDPMRLRAHLARYYHFSHTELGRMHYLTAFAYAREAQVMADEERAEYERERERAKRDYEGGAGGGYGTASSGAYERYTDPEQAEAVFARMLPHTRSDAP